MAVNPRQENSFVRVPPQNLDAERSVLGAMLQDPEAAGNAVEILQDDAQGVFYAESHQHIYSAMVSLFRKNQPIDAITLKEQLSREGQLEAVGGLAYIAELSGAVPASAKMTLKQKRQAKVWETELAEKVDHLNEVCGTKVKARIDWATEIQSSPLAPSMVS